MNFCPELVADIVAIVPALSGHFEYSVPFNIPDSPTIAVGDISIGGSPFASVAELYAHLSALPAIVSDGLIDNDTHAMSIFMSDAPSVKSTSKFGISGRHFEVKVAARSISDVAEVSAFVSLANSAQWFDVFLLLSDGSVLLARGQRSASDIEWNQNLPVSSGQDLDITLDAVNGFQRVL